MVYGDGEQFIDQRLIGVWRRREDDKKLIGFIFTYSAITEGRCLISQATPFVHLELS
jgi:hypothetical protein